MRTPIIAGNWKMNTTVDQAVTLVREMLLGLDKVEGADKVLCPPFVSLAPLQPFLAGTSVQLGAQNVYFEEKGAFTGEISTVMLAGLCDYVIIGHSERRQYFGETDQSVNRKIKAVMKAGLKPIMCVGETLQENESGSTRAVITRQVKGGLEGVSANRELVVAYEPIWAIGTGKAASGAMANETIGLIRRILSEMFGADTAQAIRIQYGGSVTEVNIEEFLSQPEIDGALVGGASLKAAEFVSITEQAAKIKRK
jgi:triosephosphate isomerase (TIM)